MFDKIISFAHQETSALILFILFLCAYLGIKADSNKRWSFISGVVVTMGTAALFSNFNIIPSDHPTYDMVWKYFVPLSIPLLLFQANLRQIKQEAGPMLIVYIAGAIGTVVGSVISFLLVSIGPETDKFISMFCGSYIGGYINFVSIAKSLNVDSKNLMLSATTADNFMMVLYFCVMGLMAASTKAIAYFQPKSSSTPSAELEKHVYDEKKLSMESITLSLVISGAFFCLALLFKALTGCVAFEILLITIFTLLLANLFPNFTKRLHNAEEIGRILLMMFFAVLGASCDVLLVFKQAPLMFLMVFIIIVFQFVFALVSAKLFNIGLPETLIACNANAGGPSTVAAIASALKMKHLVVPGILCGTLGYAIGTFIGLAVSALLKTL